MEDVHSTRTHARHPRHADNDCCPFVNLNDVRCGSRFSLGRMRQAFDVCFDAFQTCPMYRAINLEAEATEHAANRHPQLNTVGAPIDIDVHVARNHPARARINKPVRLTAHGSPISLSATGS